MVDGMLSLLSLAAVFAVSMVEARESTFSNVAAVVIGMTPVLLVASMQWYLVATGGQSVGKKLLRTKIVTMDGGEVGFSRGVFMRSWLLYLITNIPLAGFILFVVNPLFIFGADRRCLHDKIAGTQVVSLR